MSSPRTIEELLPIAIVDMIFNHLDQSDLKSMRLLMKHVNRSATRLLFSTIRVDERKESIRAFLCISTHPHLCEWVTRIKLLPSGVSKGRFLQNHQESAAEKLEKRLGELNIGIGTQVLCGPRQFTELLTSFKTCLKMIRKLPNLEHLEVEFDQYWKLPGFGHDSGSYEHQDLKFRFDVLKALFSTLATFVTHDKSFSLALTNLQAHCDEELTQSASFCSVLSNLSDLSLRIVTCGESEGSVEDVAGDGDGLTRFYGDPQSFLFFKRLPDQWLKHAQKYLRSLVITCNVPFGYIPRLDLRSVKFDNLRYLEFEGYVFSHTWQLDWITSHASTLESLFLKGCVVLNDRFAFGPLDSDGYPLYQGKILEADPPDYDILADSSRSWPLQWDEFFTRLLDFPKLIHFHYGLGTGETQNFVSWSRLDRLVRVPKRYAVFIPHGGPWIMYPRDLMLLAENPRVPFVMDWVRELRRADLQRKSDNLAHETLLKCLSSRERPSIYVFRRKSEVDT